MASAVLALRTRAAGNGTPWLLRGEGCRRSGNPVGSLGVEAVPCGGPWVRSRESPGGPMSFEGQLSLTT